MKMRIYFFLICGLLLSFNQPTLIAGYADKLLGTWEGRQEGYSAEQYQRVGFRITFSEAKGNAALGSKQWRNASGEWSDSEPVQAILQRDNTFSAVDNDGYMTGKLVCKKLQFVYMETAPGDPLDDSVAVLVTLKRTRKNN